MTVPWLPVILVDVLGSLSALLIAAYCIRFSWKWSKKNTKDSFRHYVFMLTLAIGAFAIFRSFGHLIKQGLLFMDHKEVWMAIAPFSGSGNTAAFITVFAFSIYFNRLRQVKLQIDQASIDVASSKAAEDAAKQNEDRLARIFDGMEDIIYVIDSDFKIKFFNRKFQDYLPDVSVGDNCFSALMGKDQPCEVCLHGFILKKDSPYVREFLIESIGREFSLVEIPLIWADGHKVKLNVGRDITEQKLLEAQLRHAQKMEAIGTLAGGIAHDINNSLTPVTGYAELLLMKMADDDPSKQKIEDIKRCAKRATDLISRILAFSRKQIIEKKTCNINRLVENVSEMLKSIVEENIMLELLLSEDIPDLSLDFAQIEQVLVNLAVNARDAMPDGGTLLIETMSSNPGGIICKSCGEIIDGEHLLVMVSDSGIGMSGEEKEKIFEPYFTTKEKEKGTGLGLAMVHGIIHQHGGHINFYSEPGMGSTFRIYLPLTGRTENFEPKKEETEDITFGDETILIVEDNSDILKFASDCLSTFGFNVIEADCGRKAIDQFEKNSVKIDLLLSDVVMPDINGKELVEKIHTMAPDVKTLFMSGYTDNVIAQHGVLDKGVSFISKPFAPLSLAKKVREILDAAN